MEPIRNGSTERKHKTNFLKWSLTHSSAISQAHRLERRIFIFPIQEIRFVKY